MKKVFIDGSVGTTGLRIVERLSDRKDLELIRLDEEHRKDSASRRQALNAADVAFLCLSDAAAIEAVEMIENPNTVVIDTSTAHRVSEGWVYGFAELGGRREQLAGAKRIANPGCHASGFLALTAPLVEQGLLSPEEKLSCFSLTGYSGGGKKMIAEYAAEDRNVLLDAPRLYGLSQQHKHMPEMQAYAHLAVPPVFCPIVAPYYAGMEVVVPLFGADKDAICEAYRKYYTNGLVGLPVRRRVCRTRRYADHRLRQRGTASADLPLRQPRQGRVGRGDPKYEYCPRRPGDDRTQPRGGITYETH